MKDIIYIDNDYLERYKTGIDSLGRKLNPKYDDYDKIITNNRNRELQSLGDILHNPTISGSGKFEKKSPKNKDMHDRINERTKKYDTTAKHEAACILIEALNTLLNE